MESILSPPTAQGARVRLANPTTQLIFENRSRWCDLWWRMPPQMSAMWPQLQSKEWGMFSRSSRGWAKGIVNIYGLIRGCWPPGRLLTAAKQEPLGTWTCSVFLSQLLSALFTALISHSLPTASSSSRRRLRTRILEERELFFLFRDHIFRWSERSCLSKSF